MSHRHVLPGNILTGPKHDVQAGGHKHKIVGGDGWTSTDEDSPGHRHTANGQGMSPPLERNDNKQSLEDKVPTNVKEVKK